MAAPKILVIPGSLRTGSHNARLAALVTKELVVAEAEVTRISLADYPLPLFDADLAAGSGLPAAAVQLKRMMMAHQGVFIISPEYSASVTPLLKNTIDWISRGRTVARRTTRPSTAACSPSARRRAAPAAACVRSWRCGKSSSSAAARW